MNAEYMNRRMVEEVKDEEAQQMREHFEQELVLCANSVQYEVLYALGEEDSWSIRSGKVPATVSPNSTTGRR